MARRSRTGGTPLTDRQRAVIRKGARSVGEVYDLKPAGVRNFKRAAKAAIRKSGVSDVSKAYRQTIVRATRVVATRKEAVGVKRVLRRADRRRA